MTGRCRVAHMFVTLCTGGAEQHLITLLGSCNRDEYDPLVICLSSEGEMGREVAEQNVEVVSLGIPPRRLSRPWAIARIVRELKDRQVDILHTHLPHAAKYGRIAGILARVPSIVTTIHNVNPYPRWKDRVMARLLDRFTDLTVAVSEAVSRSLLEGKISNTDRTVAIPHGVRRMDVSARPAEHITLRRELKLPAEALIITTVARLVPVKRIDLLISAFADIAEDFPAAHLVVVGDGPEKDALAVLSTQLGVADRMRLTGFRRDVSKILLGADLFVLPSDSEAAGISLLEAMAAQLPSIVSRTGGMPEIVGDHCGLLFVPGDRDGLAQSLRALLSAPDLRLSMGKAAERRVAEEYSAEKMTRSLEDLYRGLQHRRSDPHISRQIEE